jgi:hypothetical protein
LSASRWRRRRLHFTWGTTNEGKKDGRDDRF